MYYVYLVLSLLKILVYIPGNILNGDPSGMIMECSNIKRKHLIPVFEYVFVNKQHTHKSKSNQNN